VCVERVENAFYVSTVDPQLLLRIHAYPSDLIPPRAWLARVAVSWLRDGSLVVATGPRAAQPTDWNRSAGSQKIHGSRRILRSGNSPVRTSSSAS
jgi:hypothetical protein